jgi:hypothetical protein
MALAGELVVEVVPDPPEVRRARTTAERRHIPVVSGDALLDGRLDEELWREAPRTRLGPWMDGPSVPETELAVAVGEQGLSLALWGLAPDAVTQVLVDPDGLRSRWLRVTLRPEGMSMERCGILDAQRMAEGLVPVRTQTLPCEPLDTAGVVWGRREDRAAELRLPWDWLPGASTSLTLLWSQWEGSGGGTLAPHGRRDTRPELGRRLDVPMPRGRLRLAYDPETGRADRVEVQLRKGTPGTWRWERTHRRRVVASGMLDVQGHGRHTVLLEAPVAPDEVFELRGPSAGPLAPTITGRLHPRDAEAWLVTPWAPERIGVRWVSPRELEAVEVVVTTVSGTRRRTTVALPEGAGVIWITPPDDVITDHVSVGPWLVEAPVWHGAR